MSEELPVLIDIQELARLLNRSVGSLERDQVTSRVPAPVYIGASRRWRRSEVLAWVEAGCPAGATGTDERGHGRGQ